MRQHAKSGGFESAATRLAHALLRLRLAAGRRGAVLAYAHAEVFDELVEDVLPKLRLDVLRLRNARVSCAARGATRAWCARTCAKEYSANSTASYASNRRWRSAATAASPGAAREARSSLSSAEATAYSRSPSPGRLARPAIGLGGRSGCKPKKRDAPHVASSYARVAAVVLTSYVVRRSAAYLLPPSPLSEPAVVAASAPTQSP